MTWSLVKERPVAWCLTIAGVTHRYFARAPGGPGANLMSGLVLNTGLTYIDVDAVSEVGPIVASIDDVGGIARQDPVQVRLLARDAYAYGSPVEALYGPGPRRVQPYHTLRRTTPSGASQKAQLQVSVPHGLAVTDVIVDRDVTGWLDPVTGCALIHIGQEAMWATGAAGDGSSGNPWRFTGCTRGAALTQAQGHIVSEARGEFPWVTPEPVFWRGRRARIHCAEIYPDKSVGVWKEYWRGFIDSAPELSTDGLGLKLSIAPMTIAFSWTLGAADTSSKTTVVPNWHYLVKGIASELNAKAFWASGELYISPCENFNPVTGEFDVSGYAFLDSAYEPGLPNNNTRHGQLQSLGSPPPTNPPENIDSIAVAGFGNDARLTFDGGAASPLFIALSGELIPTVKNPNLTEYYPLSLLDGPEGTEELVPWPGRLIETINHQQDWNKTVGPIACWASPLALSPPTYDRWAYLSVRGVNATVLRARKSVYAYGQVEIAVELESDELCWGGFIVRAFEGGIDDHRAWEHPVQAGDNIPHTSFFCDANPDDEHSALEITGAPDWWYQPGELFIGPFADDIYTANPVGSAQLIRIEGAGTSVEVPIVGSTQVLSPDDGVTVIGYLYTVDPSAAANKRVRPIAMMPGDSLFTATAISQARGVSAPEFILQLAMSCQGRGINGANDVMGCGLNFGQAEVDEASFEGLPVPQSLQEQTWEAHQGQSVGDQIKGLLLASSCQIAQVWDALYETWRVALVNLTAVSPLNSAFDITDDDTLSPVASVTDGRVIRTYELEVNIPAPGVEGESNKITFIDAAARNAAGGDQGETLKISLPGVVIGTSAQDQSTALLDVISDLRNRIGVERVRWNVRVPADLATGALTVGIGDTVKLTSVYATDLNPETPVVSRPCRVYGLTRDLEANSLDLKLVPYPGDAAGYVPSMRVSVVIDGDSVYVEDTVFSRDGVLDGSFFQVGSTVYCYPVGDFASRVTTQIASISYGGPGLYQVTTVAPHGLGVGGIITFADYDSVLLDPGAPRYYAYIADSSETLGAGGDPAYLIS